MCLSLPTFYYRRDTLADGAQTRIARRNAVGAVFFEVVEKRQDDGSIEVVERQHLGLALTVLLQKRQQQAKGVAVGVDGLWADGLLL